jgi:hypothetical protein
MLVNLNSLLKESSAASKLLDFENLVDAHGISRCIFGVKWAFLGGDFEEPYVSHDRSLFHLRHARPAPLQGLWMSMS